MSSYCLGGVEVKSVWKRQLTGVKRHERAYISPWFHHSLFASRPPWVGQLSSAIPFHHAISGLEPAKWWIKSSKKWWGKMNLSSLNCGWWVFCSSKEKVTNIPWLTSHIVTSAIFCWLASSHQGWPTTKGRGTRHCSLKEKCQRICGHILRPPHSFLHIQISLINSLEWMVVPNSHSLKQTNVWHRNHYNLKILSKLLEHFVFMNI